MQPNTRARVCATTSKPITASSSRHRRGAVCISKHPKIQQQKILWRNRRIHKTVFKSLKFKVSSHFFKSVRGPAFSYNTSLKAAHASAKHLSQNSLPLLKNTPSFDAFLHHLNKTRISNLCGRSDAGGDLNMSPAAHFAKAWFQTLNPTMPFSSS